MVIRTHRSTVRPFVAGDAADLHDYLADPTTYRYEPGEPITLDQAADLARERATRPDFWAIESVETGRMIGHLFFGQSEPAVYRSWELGFIVSPAHRHRGYATEAAAALLWTSLLEHPIHRVVAHCNPDNVASWRLLERLGFRREGLLRKNVFFRRGHDGSEWWTDTYVYALLEEEARERLGPVVDAAGVQPAESSTARGAT
jgi:[ribosomal protein S5]-alanine N-acetyltransferase